MGRLPVGVSIGLTLDGTLTGDTSEPIGKKGEDMIGNNGRKERGCGTHVGVVNRL